MPSFNGDVEKTGQVKLPSPVEEKPGQEFDQQLKQQFAEEFEHAG
jgi:hypothetical protein